MGGLVEDIQRIIGDGIFQSCVVAALIIVATGVISSAVSKLLHKIMQVDGLPLPSSSIIIKHENKTIDAKSVINVMAAGIKKGMTVTLICDGADEDKAMAKLTDLIESGLGELTTRY